MRATTLAFLLLLPTISAADTYVPTCPSSPGSWQGTLNGIGYSVYSGLDNLSENIAACFSAPVSFYAFSLTFPSGVVNPHVATNMQYTSVTWSDPPVPYIGPIATASGPAPDVTEMFIGASVDRVQLPGGLLGPVGFAFISLTGSGSGISQIGDAPEPATLTLIGSALFALPLARRWRSAARRNA
jgi:hypothetical protein